MKLEKVYVSSSVAFSCFTHALSTEKEEIMGLLLGQTFLSSASLGLKYAYVWDTVLLPRMDKRPDRVEILPESLIGSTDEAERLTAETGQHTRTIGWYHSHPHITHLPSHVDLASQGMWQNMETGWVGLIFSVFNIDGNKTHKMHLHCFQTLTINGKREHIKVPIMIVQHATICQFPQTKEFDCATRLCALLRDEAEGMLIHAMDTSTTSPNYRTACEGVYAQQMYKVTEGVASPFSFLLTFVYLGCIVAHEMEQLNAIESNLRLEEELLEKEIDRLKKELEDDDVNALLSS